MALAPQNEETFFREVDDELRRERMETFFTRHGTRIAIAVVVALAVIGGLLYWQHRRTLAADADSEILSQALTDLSEGREAGIAGRLAPLLDGSRNGYRAASQLTLAAAAQVRDDRAGALSGFQKVIDDASAPQTFRDAATVRKTAIEYDTLPPAQVIARLKPLAVAGSPWFGSAGEMVAIAHLRLKQPREAGQLFAAIARDPTLPDTLRGRAARVAGGLGQDGLPEIGQAQTAQEGGR